MPSIILHLANEDPVLGDIEQMPGPGDMLVVVRNPRRRDGKDLPYLDPAVTTVVWPVSRINFIEIVPSDSEEKLITHVRE